VCDGRTENGSIKSVLRVGARKLELSVDEELRPFHDSEISIIHERLFN